jgi:hypothetical protein
MIFTSVTYLFLQGPGLYLEEQGVHKSSQIAAGEKPWALAGAIMCFILFAGYMRYQAMVGATEEDVVCLERRSSVTQAHIGKGDISLRGIMKQQIMTLMAEEESLGEASSLKGVRSKAFKKLEVEETKDKETGMHCAFYTFSPIIPLLSLNMSCRQH